MIYSILSILFSFIYPFGSDIALEVTLGITLLLNIGISLIMLPINIRLAGQLVMQVFKYRYICNHVATLDREHYQGDILCSISFLNFSSNFVGMGKSMVVS